MSNMFSGTFHRQLVLTVAATYLVMGWLWILRRWITWLWMTDIQALEVDHKLSSLSTLLMSCLIETTTTRSKSVAGGLEQRADPVLPLILSYPENNTAPDASVPLSPEELAGKGLKLYIFVCLILHVRSGSPSRTVNHKFS